jgi:hypothetical protein
MRSHSYEARTSSNNMSEVQFEILEDDSTDENEGQPYFYLAQDSEDSEDSEGDEDTALADRMASPDTTSGDRAASPINASGGAAPHKRMAPTISPTSPDTPSATASTGATPTRHIPSPSTVSPDSQLTPFASPGLCSNAVRMAHSLLPSTPTHIQNTQGAAFKRSATNDEGEKRKSEAVAATGRESITGVIIRGSKGDLVEDEENMTGEKGKPKRPLSAYMQFANNVREQMWEKNSNADSKEIVSSRVCGVFV